MIIQPLVRLTLLNRSNQPGQRTAIVLHRLPNRGTSMLTRNKLYHFIAALAIGLVVGMMTPVWAATAAPQTMSPELDAAGKAMADELKSMGLGMTPEKRKAMDTVLQHHMAGITPEVNAMGKSMAKSFDTPEMRASMDKVAKEMTGVMAKQLPVMMQAMQPMLSDLLPRLLRMQADMLQIMFAAPVPESK
jgi:hypothetical protein